MDKNTLKKLKLRVYVTTPWYNFKLWFSKLLYKCIERHIEASVIDHSEYFYKEYIQDDYLRIQDISFELDGNYARQEALDDLDERLEVCEERLDK